MTSADVRIRERIEALLRLAESPGATPEEQALALDRVTTLATKHQIDTARLNPHSGQYSQEDIVTHTFEAPERYGLEQTRYHGLHSVVEAMGASCYVQKTRHRHKTRKGRIRSTLQWDGLVVYAPESTMTVLKVLIPSLFLQEASASAAFIDRLKQDDPQVKALQEAVRILREQNASPKDFQNPLNRILGMHRKSFCLAFFVEAAERVREKRADAVQEAGRGFELVLVDTADRIAKALEDLDLSTRKMRSDAQFSQDGWDNGTAAGRQAMVEQTALHGGRPALEG